MRPPKKDVVERALKAAAKSPCLKSRRGCVALAIHEGRQVVIGEGFNGPPVGSGCDGSEECRATCNKRCVHAEVRAMNDAEVGHDMIFPYSLVHVKLGENGLLAPSGGPSCWQCSREVLDRGCQGVWLFHETGWAFYPAQAFHELTMRECGVYYDRRFPEAAPKR